MEGGKRRKGYLSSACVVSQIHLQYYKDPGFNSGRPHNSRDWWHSPESNCLENKVIISMYY